MINFVLVPGVVSGDDNMKTTLKQIQEDGFIVLDIDFENHIIVFSDNHDYAGKYKYVPAIMYPEQ